MLKIVSVRHWVRGRENGGDESVAFKRFRARIKEQAEK